MRKWNKLLALLLAMVMALSLAVTGFAADADDVEGDTPAEDAVDYTGWDTIKVFETTDVHGWMVDVSTYDEATFQYRLARIAQIVNDARANEEYAGVLLLDGGDIYQGTPMSNLTYGNAVRAAYDKMGYDAVGLGNHEFDWDVVKYAADDQGTMPAYEIGETKGDSDIPVLMYNLYDAETGEPVSFTKDYVELDKGGYKVVVLGYAEDYSPDIMAAKIAPYKIDADLEKLAEKAAAVKEETKADVLVILAHADPASIAEAMDPEVVDMVIGGHTHTNLAGTAENGVAYIQARNQARNYATAEIKINPETKEVAVVALDTPVTSEEKEELYYKDGENELLDAGIVAVSQAAWDEIKDDMYEVLITVDQNITKSPINEDTTTSVAGNWQAQIMLDITDDLDTIAAFTNSGGIRTEFTLAEGEETRDITVADIYTMIAFGNRLYTYSITGQQLAQHLELALQGSYDNSNYGDQFSGIVVEYYDVIENGEKTGIKVTKITTDDGKEIDINDTETLYNVCVNQYNATLPGSIFENMTALVANDDCPIDNEDTIAALRAYREENGPAWEVDTTVRAVKVEAPASEPAYTDVPEGEWYTDAVDFVTVNKLMDGLTEDTFAPDEATTRAVLADALYRMAGSPEVTGENPFEDVDDSASYVNAVIWAKDAGVIGGVNEDGTLFEPEAAVYRRDIATMLARFIKAEVSEDETDLSMFGDADSIADYAKAYVSWAVANEILGGDGEGNMNPDNTAKRSEIAIILQRFAPLYEAAQTPAEEETEPTEGEDATDPAETEENATWGSALEMILLYDGYEAGEDGWAATALKEGYIDAEVDVDAVITRAEACELLAKVMGLEPSKAESSFSDTDNAYVQALVDAEIIRGLPDGTFAPEDPMTKDQLFTTVAKATDAATWNNALEVILGRIGGYEAGEDGWTAVAVKEGFIDAEVDGDAYITRLDTCELLAKAMKLEPSEAESTLPDTDSAYVQALVDADIIHGFPDGNFYPDYPMIASNLLQILMNIATENAAA